MRLSLRAGEKVYVNGAVLRVDRKVTIELLNDATFLLEGHVIQPDEANTPLRQLYFALQTMLIEPGSHTADYAYQAILVAAQQSFSNPDVLAGLRTVATLAEGRRLFEALKTIRRLFPVEADILSRKDAAPPEAA